MAARVRFRFWTFLLATVAGILLLLMQTDGKPLSKGIWVRFSSRPVYQLQPSAGEPAPLVLRIATADRWYFNGRLVAPERFSAELLQAFARHPNRAVCIEAGEGVRFAAPMTAIDQIQGLFGTAVMARQCAMRPPMRFVAQNRRLRR